MLVHDALPVATTSDPARLGKTVRIRVQAPDDPGRQYVLAASLGTTPRIRVDKRVIPLNPDGLFHMSVQTPSIFEGFLGMLDGNGRATAKIHVPPLSFLVGLEFFVTGFTVRPGAPSSIGTISLPIRVGIVP